MNGKHPWAPVAILFVGATAAAQILPPETAIPQDYQQVIADYEAAAAAARRPGDESLGCEAIQAEIQATMASPELAEYFATTGAAAQRDLAAMQSAQAAVLGAPAPGPGTPGQPAVSLPPAGALAAQAATSQRLADHARQMEQLSAIMPLLMRSQRLTELAVLKGCDWLTDAAPDMAMPER